MEEIEDIINKYELRIDSYTGDFIISKDELLTILNDIDNEKKFQRWLSEFNKTDYDCFWLDSETLYTIEAMRDIFNQMNK